MANFALKRRNIVNSGIKVRRKVKKADYQFRMSDFNLTIEGGFLVLLTLIKFTSKLNFDVYHAK